MSNPSAPGPDAQDPAAPGASAPGPSPAYDPFRGGPASAPHGGAGEQRPPQGQPQQGAPQQGRPGPGQAPMRNADGSWTVPVAGGAGYPEPRRPLTNPVPVQRSAPGQATPPQQPGQPPFGQQPPGQPPFAQHPSSQERPRRRRLGLILGISIPVAVLAVLALVAALVGPGIPTARDAQAAADEYAAERADWEAVYSDEALQPLAELDVSDLDAALVAISYEFVTPGVTATAPDPSAVQSACEAVAATGADAEALGAVDVPELREVEGGERNADYAAALADRDADAGRYAAGLTLAGDVAGSFQTVQAVCDLVVAMAAIDADLVDAFGAYEATLTIPEDGTERFDHSTGWVEFTCLTPSGCTSFVDREARATAGDAWDASVVSYYSARATAYADLCPTVGMQPVCDAWSSAATRSAELAAAVGAAYRDEDVTGGAVSGGDTFPAPDLQAAWEGWFDGTEEAIDAAEATTEEETGSPTDMQAFYDLVLAEAQTVRDAAAAVRG